MKQMESFDEEGQLRRAFQTFDTDGDGSIDAKELVNVLSSGNQSFTREEAEEMIRVADINNDGKVDFEGKVTATVTDLYETQKFAQH